MGETGPQGEDVDERLWNDEDKEEGEEGQVGGRWPGGRGLPAGGCALACSLPLGLPAATLPPGCRALLLLVPGGLPTLPRPSPCALLCAAALALPQEPQDADDDKPVQVGDKSQLDYAAGGEDDDDGGGQQQREEARQEQQQQPAAGGPEEEAAAAEAGVEEEQPEEEEELGDYQDRWV